MVYLGLTSNTTMRSLNAMLCRFYGLPERGNADVLAHRAAGCVTGCKTRLIIVDVLLDVTRRDGREVANHFSRRPTSRSSSQPSQAASETSAWTPAGPARTTKRTSPAKVTRTCHRSPGSPTRNSRTS